MATIICDSDCLNEITMHLDLRDVLCVIMSSKSSFFMVGSIIQGVASSMKSYMFGVLEYAAENARWDMISWIEATKYCVLSSTSESLSIARCRIIDLLKDSMNMSTRDAMEKLGIYETVPSLIHYYVRNTNRYIDAMISMDPYDVVHGIVGLYGMNTETTISIISCSLDHGNTSIADIYMSMLDSAPSARETAYSRIMRCNAEKMSVSRVAYYIEHSMMPIDSIVGNILEGIANGNDRLWDFLRDITIRDGEISHALMTVINVGRFDVLTAVYNSCRRSSMNMDRINSSIARKMLHRGVKSYVELGWIIENIGIDIFTVLYSELDDRKTLRSVLEWITESANHIEMNMILQRIDTIFRKAVSKSWIYEVLLVLGLYDNPSNKNICIDEITESTPDIVMILVHRGFNVSFSYSADVSAMTMDTIIRLHSVGVDICKLVPNALHRVLLTEENPTIYLESIGFTMRDIIYETASALIGCHGKLLSGMYNRKLDANSAAYLIRHPMRNSLSFIYAIIAGGMGKLLLDETDIVLWENIEECMMCDATPSYVRIAAFEDGLVDKFTDLISVDMLIDIYNSGVPYNKAKELARKTRFCSMRGESVFPRIPRELMAIILGTRESAKIYKKLAEYMDTTYDFRFVDILL